MSTVAANEFAQWLSREHADIYAQLYQRAKELGVGAAHRSLRGFGDDVPISDTEVTVSADVPAADTTYTPDAPIQDVGMVDTSTISAPNIVTQPDSGTSGGVLSALSDVGSWIVSPQGLTTLANVGTAVLKVQQAQATANLQMAVIQQNAQRAAQGKSPVPITYVTDATGHVVPVYDSGTMSVMPPQLEQAVSQGRARQVVLSDGSTGYAVDNPTLNALFSSVPWQAWLIGAALFIAAIL